MYFIHNIKIIIKTIEIFIYFIINNITMYYIISYFEMSII